MKYDFIAVKTNSAAEKIAATYHLAKIFGVTEGVEERIAQALKGCFVFEYPFVVYSSRSKMIQGYASLGFSAISFDFKDLDKITQDTLEEANKPKLKLGDILISGGDLEFQVINLDTDKFGLIHKFFVQKNCSFDSLEELLRYYLNAGWSVKE